MGSFIRMTFFIYFYYEMQPLVGKPVFKTEQIKNWRFHIKMYMQRSLTDV